MLLVFANKQDLPNAMNVAEITGKHMCQGRVVQWTRLVFLTRLGSSALFKLIPDNLLYNLSFCRFNEVSYYLSKKNNLLYNFGLDI